MRTCGVISVTRGCQSPTGGIISKEYAAERAKTIDMDKAHCDVEAGARPLWQRHNYLSTVDKEGNIVSFIQSLSAGLVPAWWWKTLACCCKTAARCSCSMPAHPTCSLRASARSTPSFPPSCRKAISTSGSDHGRIEQPQAHAQFVSNVVDYEMNIQARWKPRASPSSISADAIL